MKIKFKLPFWVNIPIQAGVSGRIQYGHQRDLKVLKKN